MSSQQSNSAMQFSKEMPNIKQDVNVNNKLCSVTLEQEPVASHMCSDTDPQYNKAKRKRTVFNSFQLFQLENIFKTHKYLCRKQRIIVALRLSLAEKQVKIWFQNRRMKCKKEQQSFEPKSTKYKTQPKTAQINHKGTVQRLMAYSWSAEIETTTEKLLSSRYTETNTLNNPSCRMDLNEILDLLEENSPPNSQHSNSIPSNVTYCCPPNTDIQAIKQDLETATQAWSRKTSFCENQDIGNVKPICAAVYEAPQQVQQLSQWTPNIPSATSMPSMNPTWGEPLLKRQHQL